MKIFFCLLFCFFTGELFLSSPANAKSIEHHPQQHPHVHGEANMSVVLDQDVLWVEVEAPAVNFLGFEHAPQNSREKDQSSAVESTLQHPSLMFSFSDRCQLMQQTLEYPFSTKIETKKPVDSDENSHQAVEGSTHEDTHEDTDESEHDHHDIHVMYEWQCPSLQTFAINVNLFGLFGGFRKIHAQWIAFGQQNATELNKTHSSFSLAP